MTLLQAIVLGVVQGLAQFLPVSSTAHLRAVPALFGWHFYGGTTSDPGAAFTAVVSLGTTLALVLYLSRELLHVSVAWVRGLHDSSTRESVEYRLGWYMIIATVPVAVLGLTLHSQLVRGGHNLWLLAIALLVFGVLLFLAERASRRDRDEEQLNTRDAVVVGAAQALAVLPGAGRSATTITAGLFRGLTRETAARFSFLLSVPPVVLEDIYDLRDIHKAGPGAGLTGVALIFSFVVGLASLQWFMRWLRTHTLMIFAYYRIALGAALITLLATGVLHNTR
jgi:undecaprenyl-diphosphatase